MDEHENKEFLPAPAPFETRAKAASGVDKVLRPQKAPAEGAALRPSQFAVLVELDDAPLLCHTFTKERLVLRSDLAALFRTPPSSLRWPLADPALETLYARRFLVPEGADEAGLYAGVKGILRSLKRRPGGYEGYTILTTTVCNARCPYCYEADWKQAPMSPATAEAAAAFIVRTRRPGEAPVRIQWFGGEPLCGRAGIDRICALLEENGVAFRSSMITNASLFTPELAARAARVWRVGRVQVTLDGDEAAYNRIKNYHADAALGPSPFRRVLENIRLLLAEKIAVSIRLNAGDNNLEDLARLLDELEAAFFRDKGRGRDKARRPHIYAHPLFTAPGPPDREAAFWTGFEALEARLLEFMPVSDPWRGRGRRGDSLSVSACMADNPEGSVVIDADGNLSDCEHLAAARSFGTVWAGVTDAPVHATLGRRHGIRERCRDCPWLPLCTDFTGCPVNHRDCRRLQALRFRSETIRAARAKTPKDQAPHPET